jgi:hypothetical protein
MEGGDARSAHADRTTGRPAFGQQFYRCVSQYAVDKIAAQAQRQAESLDFSQLPRSVTVHRRSSCSPRRNRRRRGGAQNPQTGAAAQCADAQSRSPDAAATCAKGSAPAAAGVNRRRHSAAIFGAACRIAGARPLASSSDPAPRYASDDAWLCARMGKAESGRSNGRFDVARFRRQMPHALSDRSRTARAKSRRKKSACRRIKGAGDPLLIITLAKRHSGISKILEIPE